MVKRDLALREQTFFPNLVTGTSRNGLSTLVKRCKSNRDDSAKQFALKAPRQLCPCVIMTSTMPRAIQTVTWDDFPYYVNEYSNLNPVDKGEFSGLELSDLREKDPQWYNELEKDPFLTRFPGGECYQDLIHRLETCVIDMEQQVSPVVVVSHISVIQCLLAYFRNSPVEECTSIEVPLHTVIKLTPSKGGSWTESIHPLLPREHRRKPCAYSGHIYENGCRSLYLKTNTPIWSDHVYYDFFKCE